MIGNVKEMGRGSAEEPENPLKEPLHEFVKPFFSASECLYDHESACFTGGTAVTILAPAGL